MSPNDDYFDFIEGLQATEPPQLSETSSSPPQATDKGLKILVMSLFGLLALALIVVIMKEVVVLFVGLAGLGVLLAVFAGGSGKGG